MTRHGTTILVLEDNPEDFEVIVQGFRKAGLQNGIVQCGKGDDQDPTVFYHTCERRVLSCRESHRDLLSLRGEKTLDAEGGRGASGTKLKRSASMAAAPFARFDSGARACRGALISSGSVEAGESFLRFAGLMNESM